LQRKKKVKLKSSFLIELMLNLKSNIKFLSFLKLLFIRMRYIPTNLKKKINKQMTKT